MRCSAPIHVLVSMRVKTEWVLEKDEATGKTKPRKIGLQPVMREGIEYEFDVCGDMDQENTLHITKSRCPELSGAVFQKPGRELANVLKEWLHSDSPPPENTSPSAKPTVAESDYATVSGDDEQPRMISGELVSIWKRMCHPRGVVKEFDELRSEIEKLAGSTGIAEYSRILREHGVEHPKGFQASQPARACAKDVFGLLEELRANALEHQSEFTLDPAPPTADHRTEGTGTR